MLKSQIENDIVAQSAELRRISQHLARQKALLALNPAVQELYAEYLKFVLPFTVGEHLKWCFINGRLNSAEEKTFPELLKKILNGKAVSITASYNPVEDGVRDGENGLVVHFLEDDSLWLFRYTMPGSPCLLIKGEAESKAQMLFNGIDDPETMFSELDVLGLNDFALSLDGTMNKAMMVFHDNFIAPALALKKAA